MFRENKLNEIIKKYLAEIIVGEVESPNFLITIVKVDCSADLFLAKVYISVLPENFSGTALKRLRSNSVLISKILKKKAALTKVPKLDWIIDEDSKRAEIIYREIEKIKED